MSAKKHSGPISGFPELLPEARRVEQQWIDVVRQTFETYGFTSIETSSVEDVSTITAKGEDVDKEIYALNRLNGEGTSKDPKIALHFDLTVPLARYVSQKYADLTFPFKRYQMQKVWRGERPQDGRYREFFQCDIDVIDNNEVSLQFDAEMPRMIHKVLGKLGISDIQTNINNRKIIQGYYMGIGIENPMNAIRIIDKIEKIGKDGVMDLLQSQLGLEADIANKCIQLAEIKTIDSSFASKINALGVNNDTLDKGIYELKYIMDNLSDLPAGSIVANMSIARGLDYYTGTVFEGKFTSYPTFPTIYAGGRYDNLISNYSNKKLPGVGISIGLTRILLKLFKEDRIKLAEKCPTDVLIINFLDSDFKVLNKKAEIMRDNGINVEIYHDNKKKIGTQLQYADKKGIHYAIFSYNDHDEVKDLITGEQEIISIDKWKPKRDNSYHTIIIPSPLKVFPKIIEEF